MINILDGGCQSPDLVSRSLLQHRWGVPSAKKASDSKSSGSNGGGLSKLVIDETGSVTLHKASRSQSPVPRKRPRSQQLQATTDSPEIKTEVIDVETYQPRNERQQLEPIARPNKPIEKTTENNEQPMISPGMVNYCSSSFFFSFLLVGPAPFLEFTRVRGAPSLLEDSWHQGKRRVFLEPQ